MAHRRSLAIFFWILGAFVLIFSAVFVWLLKDGLGPGATDSGGLKAFSHFCQGMAQVAAFYLVPLIAGCLIYPWKRQSGDPAPTTPASS